MKISPQTVARAGALHPWRTIGVWVVLLFGAFALISALLSGALTTQASFLGSPQSKVGADLLSQRMGMPQKAHEVVVVARRAGWRRAQPFARRCSACRAGSRPWGQGSSTAW